ncbi:MAG: phenylalanine--tRNA ligase subunit beta [Armatimonadetes bacterium]|nr:phenylalanine--tRNA ligase subunit beta [Armatimonadota bacterium]
MKFPYSMLLDYVETGLTAHQIGDLLTMAGFELEGIEEFGDEWVLDIKVMSNRGDGLSVFGLAREVLAKDQQSSPTKLYQRAAARFQDIGVPATIFIEDETARIESESCRRFAVRGFSGVNAKDQSPAWMQKRLDASGMRPISLLVDLTNYIMLELGQPLHAFDRDKLSEGRIVVRHAGPGEKLTTLNGLEHELDGQMMICDAAKPVGVPGVMGGLETEVTDETTNLLLESANFVNTVVRKTRKQLGLATEASYRFERSVDPDGVVAATLRFTELLLDSQPGIQVSNIVDLYPGQQTFAPVRLRIEKACILLGMDVTLEQATTYLRRLGMDVSQSGGDLMVVPPSWRPDIVREEDLVEELGRVHGYELIPEAYPAGSTPLGGSHGYQLLKDRFRESLVRAGLTQIISHSLRDFHPLDRTWERVAPRNPASPEHCVLRNSLLPCLADAARRNGGKDLHLFEMGKVFWQDNGTYDEGFHFGMLSQGGLMPENRKGDKVPQADFYSLKAVLEHAFEYLGISRDIQFLPLIGDDARFHPTRSAMILVGSENCGTLGQIHPEAAKASGLEPDTVLCEFDWDLASDKAQPTLSISNISRHPAVRRDIAVLVDKAMPYEKIEFAIKSGGGDVLEKQWLFDVFEGANIPDGKHSLGIGLQFRKHGNFTDEEANQVRDRIVAELESLGATLR